MARVTGWRYKINLRGIPRQVIEGLTISRTSVNPGSDLLRPAYTALCNSYEQPENVSPLQMLLVHFPNFAHFVCFNGVFRGQQYNIIKRKTFALHTLLLALLRSFLSSLITSSFSWIFFWAFCISSSRQMTWHFSSLTSSCFSATSWARAFISAHNWKEEKTNPTMHKVAARTRKQKIPLNHYGKCLLTTKTKKKTKRNVCK